MPNVNDIRYEFVKLLIEADPDQPLNNLPDTLEIIGASFVADEDFIFLKPNADYIQHEIAWYKSQSLNINDIYHGLREPPEAWKRTANEEGHINSNYGHLVFSGFYCWQSINCINELITNPNSRRATMIYTRPSIWHEYKYEGKNDFICTNAVTYYIREGVLHCVVQMRSNDAIYGYRNDYAWQKYMLDYVAEKTKTKPGTIVWQVQNLHIYRKHYHLIKI